MFFCVYVYTAVCVCVSVIRYFYDVNSAVANLISPLWLQYLSVSGQQMDPSDTKAYTVSAN